MTDDSLKTVEKLYKLHDVDGIQNLPFWKNTQGSILQLKTMSCKSWNVSVSQGIVMHSQS